MAALKPIKQSDPPPMKRKTGPRGSKYDPVIEELKTNPGEWFLVVEDVTTTTSRVFKQKGCKTTTRMHEGSAKPNRVDVWAMWPGEKTEQAPPPKKTGTTKAAPKATPKKVPSSKAPAAKRPSIKK
jgi:hypothetical protein